VFLSYLPVMALASSLDEYYHPDWLGEIVGVSFVIWGIAFIASIIFKRSFRCPRCSKPFFRTFGWHAIFGHSCWRCGLRRGEQADIQKS
jgi:hypothetical protein